MRPLPFHKEKVRERGFSVVACDQVKSLAERDAVRLFRVNYSSKVPSTEILMLRQSSTHTSLPRTARLRFLSPATPSTSQETLRKLKISLHTTGKDQRDSSSFYI